MTTKTKRYRGGNNQIELLILAGFIGFIIGCALLFGRDVILPGRESVFHEISHDPRYVLNTLIEKRKESLKADTHSTSVATSLKLDTLKTSMLVSTDSAFFKRPDVFHSHIFTSSHSHIRTSLPFYLKRKVLLCYVTEQHHNNRGEHL